MTIRKIIRSIFAPATLPCAVAFVLFTIPVSAQQQLQVLTHHVPSAVTSGQAKLVGRLPSTRQMHLSIVLPLRNQAGLTSLLRQLYNPHSPNYRHFLTVAQFSKRFGPTVDDYQAVVDFAQANGFTVTGKPADRMSVPVIGTTAEVENALHITMNVYQHPTENRTFFAPDHEPSLNLSVPIAHIFGLNSFSIPHPLSSGGGSQPLASAGAGPGNSYLASDMRAAYYGDGALTGSGECVSLVEFNGYNISDVTSTLAPSNGPNAASSSANGNNYTVNYTTVGEQYTIPIDNVIVDGGSLTPNQYQRDGEAEVVLDIAQVIGMAPGVSEVRVYVAPPGINGSDTYPYDILSQMVTDFNNQVGCNQASISWAWGAATPFGTPDTTLSGKLQELATLGVSFFAASGDDGYWLNGLEYYPAENPNLTAVGGTSLTTSGPGGSWVSESGESGSGGGISPDNFPIPYYQTWMNGANGTSTSYRNGPDVAMEADNDNYLCASTSNPASPTCITDGGGTSYAAPRWAGFMALANQLDHQAETNGSGSYPSGYFSYPLGFINPFIYGIDGTSNYFTDFNDIVGGNNGYTVVEGQYNMVTGSGSPKGQYFINDLIGVPPPQPGIINTVAGDGAAGYSGDGGLATSAELNYTMGVAVDSAGNIYIADTHNERIRKVAVFTGIITTVAGNGTQGYAGDGGVATDAELSYPVGVAVDSAGDIYISDAGNGRIREVTASTGIITTVAGNGTQGYAGDGGAATDAELNYPSGVAVDSAGDIYIADSGNNRIREVTASTGIITTVAGNGSWNYSGDGGSATSAELFTPSGVAVDSAGDIYIADSGNECIREVTASNGIINTVAGNGSGGYSGDGEAATSAEMSNPYGVSVDSAGDIYIADLGNSRIREVTASTGIITTVAGIFTGGDTPATAGRQRAQS